MRSIFIDNLAKMPIGCYPIDEVYPGVVRYVGQDRSTNGIVFQQVELAESKLVFYWLLWWIGQFPSMASLKGAIFSAPDVH